MTPCEQAAFAAGIEHARELALIAAVTIEVRNDAGEVRQRAAVAALRGLAEGLRDLAVAALGGELENQADRRRLTVAAPQ